MMTYFFQYFICIKLFYIKIIADDHEIFPRSNLLWCFTGNTFSLLIKSQNQPLPEISNAEFHFRFPDIDWFIWNDDVSYIR